MDLALEENPIHVGKNKRKIKIFLLIWRLRLIFLAPLQKWNFVTIEKSVKEG